jgi:hypothetical protein
MTVHIHKDITSVCAGGSSITQDQAIADLATDRTWAFEAPPNVEARVLEDVELSSRSSGSVPKTSAEMAEDAAANASSARDVRTLASALKDLVGSRQEV